MNFNGFAVLTWILIRFALALGVEIQSVKLVGGPDNYINVHSTSNYTMQCNFRSGYDDPIQQVKWYKDNKPVYTWMMKSPVSTASGELVGRVRTNGGQDGLQNLNFQKVNMNIEGTYVCEVIAQNSTVRSQPSQLTVLDIASDSYSTSVNLLETITLENNATTNSTGQNCTLVWQFRTPAIFPRPNVTCGYYSYLHDDVTLELPAGLTMHRLQNGSWIAGFDHTMVEISDIPRETRLGCSVEIPGTAYKKVVKFQDSFQIDHLIDSQGCPTDLFEPSKNLQMSFDSSVINCRGDIVPTSKEQPITAELSCRPGEYALFANGSSFQGWSTNLQCDVLSMTWRYTGEMASISVTNSTDLPTCFSGYGNVASEILPTNLVTISLLLLSVQIALFNYF